MNPFRRHLWAAKDAILETSLEPQKNASIARTEEFSQTVFFTERVSFWNFLDKTENAVEAVVEARLTE